MIMQKSTRNLRKLPCSHNGAAKIGDFIIEDSGRIHMVDPSTGKSRLMFSVNNLPLVTELVAGVNSSGYANFGSGQTSSSRTLTGNTQITKDGVTVTYSATGSISIQAAGKEQSNGNASIARAVIYLRKNGVRQRELVSTPYLIFSEPEYEEKSISQSISTFNFTADAGLWDAELVVESAGEIIPQNTTASTVASRLDWVHVVAGVKRQQYGLDGMMFFYSNNHFYFTEGKRTGCERADEYARGVGKGQDIIIRLTSCCECMGE